MGGSPSVKYVGRYWHGEKILAYKTSISRFYVFVSCSKIMRLCISVLSGQSWDLDEDGLAFERPGTQIMYWRLPHPYCLWWNSLKKLFMITSNHFGVAFRFTSVWSTSYQYKLLKTLATVFSCSVTWAVVYVNLYRKLKKKVYFLFYSDKFIINYSRNSIN